MYDNSFRIEGVVTERFDAVQVTDTFRKREFVLEITNESRSEFVKFQCIQNNITLLDDVRVGNRVIVSFRLTGREWTNEEGKRYFTNLDCRGIDIIDTMNLEEHTPPADILAKDIESEIIPAAGFPQQKSSSGEDWLTGSSNKNQFDSDEFEDLPF